MANEAIQIEGPYLVRDFTVADGATIEKYTLCSLADPRTAAANTTKEKFAGIAATEKVASNGKTKLGLFTSGVFDLKVQSGDIIEVGQKVILSGANEITGQILASDMSGGYIVGTALESTAAGVEEVIEVDIGLR